MAHHVYIGIGSNLGDRKGNTVEAMERVSKLPDTRIVRASSLYESEPLGDAKTWFVNSVIEIETDIPIDGLLKKLKAWDGDMIQRRSRAYDDVENFPNRFTANYLFLVNQTESDMPRVNQPSRDRLAELNAEWATLKARADELTDKDIPALNRQLWELGVGAIWKK